MSKELKESQGKLDAIEKKIIANKEAREKLREEAVELRGQYFKEERVREALLKESLTKKVEEK